MEKVRTTIYLPVELHKEAKVFCARNDISLTGLVIKHLEQVTKDVQPMAAVEDVNVLTQQTPANA